MSQVTWQNIKDFHDAPGMCDVYQYFSGDTLQPIKAYKNL